MDDGERLAELLSVLFTDPQELERFLVVEKLPLSARPHEKGGSRRSSLRNLARDLDRAGLASDRLFLALVRRNPERTADIEQVARFYRDESFTVPDTDVPEPVPAEFAEFAASLSRALDDITPTAPPDPLDDTHRPWTTAAAVFGAFPPSELRPLEPVASSAITTLSGFVHPNLDGRWLLDEPVRVRCLNHLWRTDSLAVALDANPHIEDSKRDKLRTLVAGDPLAPNEMRSKDLEEYSVVMGWLVETDIVDPDVRALLEATLTRRDLLDPLAALVGPHFQGRESELKTVDWFVRGMVVKNALCLYGPGGVGKTSLLGKILLDLELAAQRWPTPFVYLDFDWIRNDPRDPAGLLRQIAEQLRLLYATTDEAREFAALEDLTGRIDIERASTILAVDLDLDLDGMIRVLSDRLFRVRDLHGPPGYTPPLVLFLDTFEQVQAKGPGALRDLDDFLSQLVTALPDMRLIVSGRGKPARLTGFGDPLDLPLGDLDDRAAEAVLEGLGVADAYLRELIVDKFGGNPLTLRLAANALARSGSANAAFGDIAARADVLTGVALEQVQGMLYARVLGHIRDVEVVKVAYPGLAVRRIDVDVLRKVLAEPCGLDPDRASEIFDKLLFEVGMFDREGPNAVSHRQDVRRLMLRSLLDEPQRAATVAEIHRRAIDYYRTRDRAEELYHRLVSGQDPRELDKLWDPVLRQSLEPALGELLPRRARTWLERRVNPTADEDRSDWDQEDWEADALGRALSWLSSDSPADALAVLAERSARLPGSRLYAVEAKARLLSGDPNGASSVIQVGTASAVEARDRLAQAELAAQAVAVCGALNDSFGVVTAAEWAVTSCDLLGDPERGVGVLADAVQVLRSFDQDKAEELADELATRFTHLSRASLLGHPELVKRVLHAAGDLDGRVLHHAAAQVGDQTETDGGVFQEDPFALARLLDLTSTGAQPAIDALADEVGLTRRADHTELARLVMRSGRTGKAIAVGLDWANDPIRSRSVVVDTLVRPADGRSLS
ncbi:ATP-binding protein [Alloactinosynnema sp. L-07]|uniref:ATP-binding protein n=1 Tax=Alloactinosynnema sp. L-07 TaxID=1653480 RepID=UPI0006B6615A|nr:ATP-binding protein [Alloactinosynnema sp. L-07]